MQQLGPAKACIYSVLDSGTLKRKQESKGVCKAIVEGNGRLLLYFIKRMRESGLLLPRWKQAKGGTEYLIMEA